MWKRLLFVALGGALGSLARYLLSGWVYRLYSSSSLPIGTIAVNVLGCFVLGLLWGISEEVELSPLLRLFLFVGLLGGLTTFSTFVLETLNLARDGEVRLGVANLLMSVGLGLLVMAFGLLLGKGLFYLGRRWLG